MTTSPTTRPLRLTILTGAGISADSGISTFRDADGLWESHRVEDVASPEGFARDPDLVQRFYDARRARAHEAQPNAAHLALAKLAASPSVTVTIITQNVDDLHERAGSDRVIHIHGRLDSALCTVCGERTPWHGALADGPPCPVCWQRALRPDIVWFGEPVYAMAEIADAVETCDVFAVIGTSGAVWPAAGLAASARLLGARTVLLNLDEPENIEMFDEVIAGRAADVVPVWVESVLEARGC